MKIQETTICTNFAEALKQHTYGWDPQLTYIIGECMCASAANFLKAKRSQEKPVILVIKDLEGNFKLAFIADFIPSEGVDEDAAKGNYVLSATFNESDIADMDAIVFDCNDMFFQTITKDVSYKLHHMRYVSDSNITLLFSLFAHYVYLWLDTSAKENETVMVESDGYWQAEVTVLDGIKEFKFIPGPVTKQLIKGDIETQN